MTYPTPDEIERVNAYNQAKREEKWREGIAEMRRAAQRDITSPLGRERAVREARISLSGKLTEWLREGGTRNLTDAEYVEVVAVEMLNVILAHTAMMRGTERKRRAEVSDD